MSNANTSRQQSRHLPAFILLLLAETPAHGGALMAALNARFPALKADTAAVYRALQQMEKNGELHSKWDTSGKGPAIRVYQLSKAGREKLVFWRQDIQERISGLQEFLRAYDRLAKSGDKGSHAAGADSRISPIERS
jgi:DNA-binding PadR family transcriptional regulator